MAPLLLLAGPAGCGKSTTAHHLADDGWMVVGKDALTRTMTESFLQALGHDPDERSGAAYLTQVRPLEYHVLRTVGLAVVATGDTIRKLIPG